MGAVGVGGCLELPANVIAKGIQQLTSVPGRLEKVENNLGISVLVDYAHTPDALEKVLGAVRPLTQRRVVDGFRLRWGPRSRKETVDGRDRRTVK